MSISPETVAFLSWWSRLICFLNFCPLKSRYRDRSSYENLLTEMPVKDKEVESKSRQEVQPDTRKREQNGKKRLLFSPSVMSDSLPPHELEPPSLLCPWDFPGKNSEAVAISFCKESSQPRERIRVSSIGRQILLLSHQEALNKSYVPCLAGFSKKSCLCS